MDKAMRKAGIKDGKVHYEVEIQKAFDEHLDKEYRPEGVRRSKLLKEMVGNGPAQY